MTASRSFRHINTAPVDGRLVEIVHGLKQEITLAYWAHQYQGWIRDGDPGCRVLSWVTNWRPVRRAGCYSSVTRNKTA